MKPTRRLSSAVRRAFTLTEMLVAISVLLVVVIATSTIFGTAQKVASVGESNSELLQQAIAIERVMRRDLQRVSANGFFAIQCVGVRNDVNLASTGRLLDPTRPADAEIRADQLLFFTNGATNSRQFTQSYAAGGEQVGVDVLAPAQSYFSSVFYSPGLQVTALPAEARDEPLDLDRSGAGDEVFPWSYLPKNEVRFTDLDGNVVGTTSVPLFPATVDDWVLARQEVLLADDDGARNVSENPIGADCEYYMGYEVDDSGTPIRNSVCNLFVDTADGSLRFAPELVNSRRDVAATDETQLRATVCYPWNSQVFGGSDDGTSAASERVDKESILEAMYYGYPRAELDAPGMNRQDLMLTDVVLAPFVSDFRVEWTWEDGVGRDLGTRILPNDNWQPSFGLPAGWNSHFLGGFPGVVIDGSWISDGRAAYSASGSEGELWNEFGTLRSSTTPWFGLSSREHETAPAIAFAGRDGSLGTLADAPFPGQSVAWDDQDVVALVDPNNCVRIGPPVGPELLSGGGTNEFNLSSQGSGNLFGMGDDTFADPLVGSVGQSPLTLIESVDTDGGNGADGGARIRRYGAVFGFNQKGGILRKLNGEPFTYQDGLPVFGDEEFQLTPGGDGRVFTTYTPWPSAVRVSMRLHDSNDRLSGARDVQFVIPVPRQDS
ncbi:MAG: prepilin-type N-terminal cleavage/methylation domain-containing protein [Planctomycetota bacterium]|nr:prepilin-type N-terminal cleavage/methylation domain-containing protein [Planctomycetota bacterium]MEC9157271.1 prepilin-type N-terminal cleavage/methylation domain-containing protein [Planctomycetota bacterium]